MQDTNKPRISEKKRIASAAVFPTMKKYAVAVAITIKENVLAFGEAEEVSMELALVYGSLGSSMFSDSFTQC